MPDRDPLPFDPIGEARRQWSRHGWDAAAPAMAVVTSIMRVQQLLLARADAALRPFDLTFARYEVLMLLSFSSSGALPLGKIGERLQVNPASVTNAIDRLEEQDLVERARNPDDGRGTLARLTEEGRARAAAATDAMNAGVFADLGVGAEGLDGLFELLRDVRYAAGDFTPGERDAGAARAR
ncbi:MAG TPA: MarR family transcriptional regulator [Acidimicrobiales bacterium]|nr:MarR family transcriptional regulator [Acidimicrobiales bacterium]